MINNENEFLGYLIKKSENTGYVYQLDAVNEGELSEFETVYYAKSLTAKGYITADLANYYVTEIGKKNYRP